MTSTPHSSAEHGGGTDPSLPRAETTRRSLARPVLGGVLSLAVAIGIGRFAYTPILPSMQRAAEFDAGVAGLLASANHTGYLAGALLLALVDSGTARNRILAVCLVTIGLTTGLMAATTDHAAWSIVRFLTGLASAGVFVLESGLVLNFLQRNQISSLSGWLYSGAGLGMAVSGAIVGIVDGALG